jgi:putative PIN family toxin of toxin-antitoxin system
MIINVVIDTNVIVSALLNANGLPAKILRLVFERKVKILCDTRIFAGYQNVLCRRKFHFDSGLIVYLLDFIKIEAIFVDAIPQSILFNDEDDKKFYEVFKTTQADFLITGNIKHFPKERGIITPAELYSKIK